MLLLHLKVELIKFALILYYSYQIYYSQATTNARFGSELKMVNWWSAIDGLVRFPLLPPPKQVYTDFEGRRFTVPVLHVRKSHYYYSYCVKRKQNYLVVGTWQFSLENKQNRNPVRPDLRSMYRLRVLLRKSRRTLNLLLRRWEQVMS